MRVGAIIKVFQYKIKVKIGLQNISICQVIP